jgi:hypothetical protein
MIPTTKIGITRLSSKPPDSEALTIPVRLALCKGSVGIKSGNCTVTLGKGLIKLPTLEVIGLVIGFVIGLDWNG